MGVGSLTGTRMAGISRERTFRRGASIAALLVAGWCWLALAAPAEGASSGKRLVVAPREGAKLPARPLTIKVRAARKAVLRARLNGKAIGRYFSRRPRRGVRRLRVSASHGLRHRRNVLRVRVRRPGARRARVATVHFRVATNRPLAAAGLKRTVAVHARLGFDGGRSRLHPPARRRGARLDYRWRLLRAPPGSELRTHGRNPNSAAGPRVKKRVKNLGPDALFSRRGSRTPRFRADYPGLYRFRLTVTAPDGATGVDDVPVPVSSGPLVPIDTMAKPPGQSSWGVLVGEHFYPDPGDSKKWLQVVALKPDTLELISNTPYGCPQATAFPHVTEKGQLQDCVKKLSDDLDALRPARGDPSPVVIAVSQPPDAGAPSRTEPWQTQPPVGAQEILYKVGLPATVRWLNTENPLLRGRMSAIGRFGGPATRHDNLDLADLRDTGEIKGYLLEDNKGYYTTFESGEVVPFDTLAAGSGPTTNVMSIGSQSFSESFPKEVTQGGFQVVVVDRRDLSVLEHFFASTGHGCCRIENLVKEMIDRLNAAINRPNRSGVLVFIQSLGSSKFQQPGVVNTLEVKQAARQLVDLLQGRLGATRRRPYRALDPVMAPPGWSYRLIATPGTPPGEGLEAEGPTVNGMNGAPARGYLTRSSVDYGFDVESSTLTGTVGRPGERLRSVALSTPGEWPEKGDPGRTAAIAWVGDQIGLDNRRSLFWTHDYKLGFWTTKVTTLQELTCPPKQDGFNCTDFDWARKELIDEIGWLDTAHAYVETLAEPFTKNQLTSWADVTKVATAVKDKVQAPDTDKTLLEIGLAFRLAGELAEEAPVVGEAFGIVNDVYRTALEWAKIDAEGTEAGEPFSVTVADAGSQLVDRLQAVQKTLEGQLVNVIAADYRKLRTVGLCSGLVKACPDPPLAAWDFPPIQQERAAPVVHDGIEASLYQALLPARYQAWAPPDSDNRSTNWFGHQPAGQTILGWECPFHNEPATAQVAIPIYRNLADSGPGGPDIWRVIAYADRTGTGIVGDPRVMHLPVASVTDRLFKPPSERGLGLHPESFYWRAFGPARTLPFASPGITEHEYGFPLKDSQVRWITKDDPFGIKLGNCGY
jgi:hypothetical protein